MVRWSYGLPLCLQYLYWHVLSATSYFIIIFYVVWKNDCNKYTNYHKLIPLSPLLHLLSAIWIVADHSMQLPRLRQWSRFARKNTFHGFCLLFKNTLWFLLIVVPVEVSLMSLYIINYCKSLTARVQKIGFKHGTQNFYCWQWLQGLRGFECSASHIMPLYMQRWVDVGLLGRMKMQSSCGYILHHSTGPPFILEDSFGCFWITRRFELFAEVSLRVSPFIFVQLSTPMDQLLDQALTLGCNGGDLSSQNQPEAVLSKRLFLLRTLSEKKH